MATHSDLRHNGSVIRYDTRFLDPMEPRLFDVAWLMAEGYHQGNSAGRGEAHFIRFAGREMVLRPFRRGGLVGKINRDLYLRGGLDASRPMKEFALLDWMRAQALPVPRPVAAQVTSTGIFYRAALVTERLAGARPLEDILRDRPLHSDVWGTVGGVIRLLHNAGVDHSDLNCRNILLDPEHRPWLIDFDKCRRRQPGAWSVDNLDRLKRSLVKQNGRGDGLHWEQADWEALSAGYAAEKSDGAGGRP
ncbi:MAG: 3-deoxy-D-manno-octulosonic acid kinase [Pseudomonadota bacterium]